MALGPTTQASRVPWALPFFATVLAILVVASALQGDPRPALHGTGLAVTVVVGAFIVLVSVGMILRRGLGDARTGNRLLAGVAACSLVLGLLQPEGAGFLALYITLGITCVQLKPRWAIPGFTAGIVLLSALHAAVTGGASIVNIVIGDASAVIFFFLGSLGRQSRIRQERAERLVAELEATREAHAQAIALNERARLAREMHDVLAHSLSALAVQLEGARLLARSSGADAAVIDAVERSHHLAKGGLAEARRAIEALRGGDMPGPDRLPALAEQFREQTGVETALELDGAPRELPSEARLAVYRTAQEALTNVRRHAVAERVELRLRYADDGTWLTVEDRGRPNGSRPEPGSGYGITGMRERAELLGGRLAAAPTDHGFRVELYIPR